MIKIKNCQIYNIVNKYTTLNKHKENLNNEFNENKEFKDPWIVNCTDVQIPHKVNDVLRLRNNLSSSFITKKKDMVFEIIKDIQSNM